MPAVLKVAQFAAELNRGVVIDSKFALYLRRTLARPDCRANLFFKTCSESPPPAAALEVGGADLLGEAHNDADSNRQCVANLSLRPSTPQPRNDG